MTDTSGATTTSAEWLSWTRNADYREEPPPVVVGGEGPYVIDRDGRRLLDGISGLFTTQIGYSHGAELGAAAAAQLEQLGFYPNWARHPSGGAGADRARARPRAGADGPRLLHLGRLRVRRVGLEARPPALPGRGRAVPPQGHRPPRRLPRQLPRRALAHRHPVGPHRRSSRCSRDARHVANTDRRRCLICRGARGLHLGRAEAVERRDPGRGPRAPSRPVIVEPVQNAGGCLMPPAGYGQALREICDRHGVLLWCDEVITGFGRVGEWFGSTRLGFEPDMITFAKGITSGHAPLGGVLFTDASRSRSSTTARSSRTATRSAATPSRARWRWPTSTSWSASAWSRTCGPPRATSRRRSTMWPPARRSPSRPAARASSGRSSSSRTHVLRARDAIRAQGAIVRADVRVNPCLAISPPLICDRGHVDELAAAVSAGLEAVA